jgi:hypothetical protein
MFPGLGPFYRKKKQYFQIIVKETKVKNLSNIFLKNEDIKYTTFIL